MDDIIGLTDIDAIEFLKLHQPMPADYDITQELIDKYDDVRLYFVAYPDKNAIPLLMRSFGSGDGFGVYQLVEDVFYKCDFNDVIENIAIILEDTSTIKSVRYWVTQLAVTFSDKRLINGLNISLRSDDEDISFVAASALEFIE
ncbi:hypothetical protein [Hafnia alvei]|uniref:Uncharacterized protein n=1 Tax=Hafnia alvei ATCC 51873 TaxID=1002364 RepID=G9Y4W5_HAFAL|nr:hypothetical protein [Hafnia alvei]EHM44226.1 hypothetical protein HMPREF0454_01537 [Hafnia alvei ATCC 51873]